MRTRLLRLARLATLPETRRLIATTVTSPSVRLLGHRALHGRSGLRAALTRASARRLVEQAVHHPAASELANAGLIFLPGRYVPLGWAAGWAARRVLRRRWNQDDPPRPEAQRIVPAK